LAQYLTVRRFVMVLTGWLIIPFLIFLMVLGLKINVIDIGMVLIMAKE